MKYLEYGIIESFENKIVKRNIYIDFEYIFRSKKELANGLMFVEKLSLNKGALFIMPKYKIQKFWMKNTYIPLDMIFLDREGIIVGFILGAKPHDENSYSIDKESKYIIETNSGFVKRHELEIGDKIVL
jgi:uncharacterized protein